MLHSSSVSNPGKIPPKPLAIAPLARVFGADARIASWTARLKDEAALTVIVRRQLPRPLADRVRVTGIRDGTLELATSAGAVAATVRQRTPDLIAALRREGCDFTEIRVRVQVAGAGAPRQKPLSRQLDARAFAMFDLAARLPEGPLKRALDRWSRRARGRSSG
jgi:hypothetical protein